MGRFLFSHHNGKSTLAVKPIGAVGGVAWLLARKTSVRQRFESDFSCSVWFGGGALLEKSHERSPGIAG